MYFLSISCTSLPFPTMPYPCPSMSCPFPTISYSFIIISCQFLDISLRARHLYQVCLVLCGCMWFPMIPYDSIRFYVTSIWLYLWFFNGFAFIFNRCLIGLAPHETRLPHLPGGVAGCAIPFIQFCCQCDNPQDKRRIMLKRDISSCVFRGHVLT